MRIEQVVHSLNVMSCLYANHHRLRSEEVNPFLRVAIIQQELLPDECIPGVRLVEVQPLIESCLLRSIHRKIFLHESDHILLVFVIARVAVVYIPAIEHEGEIGKPCYHVDVYSYFVGFNCKTLCPVEHASGDVQRFDSLLECNHEREEVEFLICPRHFLCLLENLEALKEQSLFIQDVSMVELLIQLQVNAVCAFQQSQAGEDLLVQMRLQVVELALLSSRHSLEQSPFIVVLHPVQRIEELHNLQLFLG